MTLAKLPPKHTASHGHCGIAADNAALASLPAAEGTTTAVSSVTGEALQQGEAKYHPSQKRSAGGRSSSRSAGCRSWRGGALPLPLVRYGPPGRVTRGKAPLQGEQQ